MRLTLRAMLRCATAVCGLAILLGCEPAPTPTRVAVRWVVSERPSASAAVGGQSETLNWVDMPGAVAVPPTGSEKALWVRHAESWYLVSVLGGDSSSALTLTQDQMKDLKPTKDRFLDIEVVATTPSGPDGESTPIPDATIQLVAGRGGTPMWDMKPLTTDQTGRASFGPVPGEEEHWWVDVSARGYATIRYSAPLFSSSDRDRGPGRKLLFPADEKRGRIVVGGKPASGSIRLSMLMPDLSPMAPLHVAVSGDGSFAYFEPRTGSTVLKVTLPDGRSQQVVRQAQTDPLVIDFD
jgi:hypothetical protein